MVSIDTYVNLKSIFESSFIVNPLSSDDDEDESDHSHKKSHIKC